MPSCSGVVVFNVCGGGREMAMYRLRFRLPQFQECCLHVLFRPSTPQAMPQQPRGACRKYAKKAAPAALIR